MADDQDDTERSEDPTQKRLDEALERGDVVKSQEVNAWFVLACATLTLMMFSGSMSHANLPPRCAVSLPIHTPFGSMATASSAWSVSLAMR